MAPHILFDEKVLLRQLQEGDYRAFEKIYDRYYKQLAGNLLRLLKSPHLAEETLQDLFVKLWEHRAKIDPEKPIKGYLFRIAENLVYDLYRKAARDAKVRQFLIASSPETYTHIEEDIVDHENKMLVHKAISLLPPRRRKIYRLCKIDGKSYDEVAAQLGISTAAVNKHVTEGNRFLRNYFASQAGSILFLASLIVENID